MTTRGQLLTLTIVGNVIIAALFLALSSDQLGDQQNANLETSARVYQQAWNTASNESFDLSIGLWHPLTGSPEKRAVWRPDESVTLSRGYPENSNVKNPLYRVLIARDVEQIRDVFTQVFEEDVDSMALSFVYILDESDQLLHCMTAFDGYGVDPCGDNAIRDLALTAKSSASGLAKRSRKNVAVRRHILRVDDSTHSEESSLHQAMTLEMRHEGKKIGAIVLGKNLFEALESFEYEFEIKAVLSFDERAIALNNYYDIDNYSGIPEDADVVGEAQASLTSNMQTLLVDGTFGAMNRLLGASVFGFPLSDFAKGEEALLMVLRDQREVLRAREMATRSTLMLGLAVFVVVLVLVIWLTTYAFNGIAKAIKVLQALVEGDHTVSMPARRGFLRSKDDEITLLSGALESYRSHLVEMEQIKLNQQDKRRERDGIIIDKMGLLADQLEGDAQQLILSDIQRMESLSDNDTASESEDASVELMSMAFSRMSHEVTALLDAKTKEMQDAYEQASTANREIQSSINYAAKLQRALLRAERLPDDFKIDLTWRPRDVVGGDIYVVRTTENKTVIAVIDCTGHGVPGAFTSVIARAVVDRAIEDDQINTAGEYLSASNRLIKNMLFQNESEQADSDAGFDGTVCILDRETGQLEFAGANSSLFVISNGKIAEIKGDKKSVGARRTPSTFEFSTQVIQNPQGMFVMLTDGVTDVMNELPRPIAFGRKRLMRLLEGLDTSDPQLVISRVMEAIDHYKGSTPLRDDLTLLAFYLDEFMSTGVDESAYGVANS